MRGRLALALSITVALSGCTITNYKYRDRDDVEVRVTGKKPGETFVRSVSVKKRHHFFLLGFLGPGRRYDIEKDIPLKKGETLVNLDVENAIDGLDGLVLAGGLVLWGLGPFIWMTRSSRIRADIVTTGPTTAKAAVADEAAEPEPEAKPAAPVVPMGPWKAKRLDRAYAHGWAKEACTRAGATLPTRAELKEAKPALAGEQGDVWTSERKGDDAWTVSLESGAAFLRDPEDKLDVVCLSREALK